MYYLDIKTAKIICDLSELLSFSKVAEKHKISQSAVSQTIRRLEKYYECRIVDRKKYPLILTETGKLFYSACKDILKRHEELINEINPQSPNQVKIAAVLSIGMYTLKPYIKKILAECPEVEPTVEYYEANQIYNRILSGDSHIGIVAVPQKKCDIDIYPFENEPLVAACNPEHSLANNISVDINNLQDHDFIAFDKNIPTRKYTDSILKKYNICVNIKKEAGNIEIIKRAVEINLGISILPQTAMVRELFLGTLRAIPFSNERFVRPTGILVGRTAKLDPSVQHFLDLLLKKEITD